MQDNIGAKLLERERQVIVGLTAAAARLIGIAIRDKRPDLLDEAAEGLEGVVDGLERFRQMAGSDTGTEFTIVAIRQIVGWMRKRNLAEVTRAINDRHDFHKQPAGFYRSMNQACREQRLREPVPGA